MGFGAFGVEDVMGKVAAQAFALRSILREGRGEGPFGEPLPDIVHGHVRGVEHSGLVEAVVAQFVHQDFVGREVTDALAKPLLQGIYQQE